MITDIIMPKLGMVMEEGKIIRWLKKEGDKVEKGEPLLEIETDKVTMEVEAVSSGVLLKIVNKDGEVVPVTQTIGYIGDVGDKIEEANKSIPKQEQSLGTKTSSTREDKYNVVVIGGGPAGYVAAIKTAQLGGKVALVEKDNVGGTCLNRGCIPTKTYLKTAETIEAIKRATDRGITLESTSLKMDMNKAVEHKNKVVKTLTSGVSALLRSYGVDVYKGTGRITKDKNVVVNGDKLLETNKIILASGSKAAKINIPGAESSLVLTSDDILDLKEVPNRLTIVGGGVIGVEMAVVFNSFGSKVTIVEVMDRIVPEMDKDISAELLKFLKRSGIEILTSTKLEKIEQNNEELTLYLDSQDPIKADKVLFSIGRVPELEALGDIKLDTERGRVKVNNKMETSVPDIYAAGDINGLKMLAHAAFHMAEVAAANAMGKEEVVKLQNIPSCIYTIPEVGAVGMTEEQARSKYDITVGKFPFAANGRALASGEGIGFVKVIADRQYGEILGVHIIGPGAAEMINEAAALMDMQITVNEVSKIIHGHPTFSEAFMEAVADCLNTCIHLPKK